MQFDSSIIKRSLMSGTVSGIATTLAAALAGKRETSSYAAPINATSHIVWGDEAARHNRPSLKYTGTGFLLNHAATIMWAAVYEKWAEPAVARWLARRPALVPYAPAISAAAVSAGAYVTDYYLVPKRFTPGYEKRLSGPSMALIFGALAAGLAASTLLMDRLED
ncbi:MAG TPA: hypothetical protein DHV59_17725 [Oxalobacteraceae bacterium]|nr:hypothetical protein [Oxalobacteraceae bacterium]